MINKKIISLAVVGLTAVPAFAAEFQPTADTKFEVNVEVAAYQQSMKNSAGVSKKQFMGKGLNQIEIKATHKLNDDLSLFGEIEVDYDPIVDNDTVKTDDTRVGLSSKKFGRFTVGQFDTFFEDNVGEALGVGHGDKAFLTEPGSNNDERHIQYLQTFGDFTLAIDFMNSSNTGTATSQNTKNGNAVTLAYKLGDLTLAAGSSKIAGYKSDDGATTP